MSFSFWDIVFFVSSVMCVCDEWSYIYEGRLAISVSFWPLMCGSSNIQRCDSDHRGDSGLATLNLL